MFCRIIYFKFLGVLKVSHGFIENFTSFIDCSFEIVVFRGERRIKDENRVRSSFTNGDFRAIKMKSGVLFEVYIFLFLFCTHSHCREP